MCKSLLITLLLAGTMATIHERALGSFFRYRTHCLQPYCPLTEHSARRALISMLERVDAPNFDTRAREIAALKNGKNLLILEKNADGISGGYWNCDLDAKRFSFITTIGGCLFNCHGVFEHVDGRWRAQVQGSSWALFK